MKVPKLFALHKNPNLGGDSRNFKEGCVCVAAYLLEKKSGALNESKFGKKKGRLEPMPSPPPKSATAIWFTVSIEATLKKILSPVQRPGVYITAEWELFFHFAQKKNFFGQNFIIFLPTKKEKGKKKDFAATRLATISATRWTGNKVFFKGGLSVHNPLLEFTIIQLAFLTCCEICFVQFTEN